MKLTKCLKNHRVALGAVLLAGVLAASVHAQTQPGKALVQAISGSAVYSTPGAPAIPLKVGTLLESGATIKTAKDSIVDLFLGNSAGVVRVAENTTLSLDKLALTDTGADTVVDVQLHLPEGTMLFNVNKLSAASKYEIKVPNGVAGIRGTAGRINASSFIVLRDGKFVFVYAPPNGTPTPHVLTAPPVVYFSPYEGVKLAPQELVRELDLQMQGLGTTGKGPAYGRDQKPGKGPPQGVPWNDPHISPGQGALPPGQAKKP